MVSYKNKLTQSKTTKLSWNFLSILYANVPQKSKPKLESDTWLEDPTRNLPAASPQRLLVLYTHFVMIKQKLDVDHMGHSCLGFFKKPKYITPTKNLAQGMNDTK